MEVIDNDAGLVRGVVVGLRKDTHDVDMRLFDLRINTSIPQIYCSEWSNKLLIKLNKLFIN